MLNKRIPYFLLLISFFFLSADFSRDSSLYARKVKQSLKIGKEKKSKEKDGEEEDSNVIRITLSEGIIPIYVNDEKIEIDPASIKFTGYEKEANSSHESIIIVNDSPLTIKNIATDIVYTDLKGRMIHKRPVYLNIEIPSGESRKIDFKTWDIQHTYYYHLGNAPKKTATPYKVKFEPIYFDFLTE